MDLLKANHIIRNRTASLFNDISNAVGKRNSQRDSVNMVKHIKENKLGVYTQVCALCTVLAL